MIRNVQLYKAGYDVGRVKGPCPKWCLTDWQRGYRDGLRVALSFENMPPVKKAVREPKVSLLDAAEDKAMRKLVDRMRREAHAS